MPESTFSDPCIVFALRRESLYFRRRCRRSVNAQGLQPLGLWAELHQRVLVLESGMGTAAMERALSWVLGSPRFGGVPYRPRLVLSAGFSGALCPERRVGDLILATDIVDSAGNHWPATWPADFGSGDGRPPLHRGRLLSLPELVADPKDKRRLGAEHQAVAVDMETAVVARLCSRAGVPFGCLRAISDDGGTPLSPYLAGILQGGRVAPLRLAATVLRHPAIIGELWRLARDTRQAAQQLARGLEELLTPTLPWTREGTSRGG